MIDEQLQRLKETKQRLANLEKERQESYIFWSIWKHYAQNEPYFDTLKNKYEIPWKELKYNAKDTTGEIVNSNFVSYEHGEELWTERATILDRIQAYEEVIDECLEYLFCENEVPLSTIGKYYGASPSGVYNYLTSRPWFTRRKDKVK